MVYRGQRQMCIRDSICRALDCGADELLWGVAGAESKAVLDMWNLPDKGGEKDGKKLGAKVTNQDVSRNADSYAMYVKIMKSVAEIMNGK